ncbi:MAG: threonine/serine exporter family protein [Muribaculaceae bacterium]|nr:threonine/serine exporter family protein [Muribaculaceae bacterium]
MSAAATSSCVCPDTSTKDVGCFLAHYASCLMGCGATCIRIEKNVNRIARAYGKRAEITTMTRHIQISVYNGANELDCLTLNISVKPMPIDFTINTRLSELSWKIADTGLPLDRAWNDLHKIIDAPRANANIVLLLVSCANAAFCRLFGGDPVAMAVVFIATLAGFRLKTELAARKVDVRIIFIVCAFVSTVLGCTDMLFGLGATPRIAIATSVLYLVPGIPFLNSFSDMLYRHYLCAMSRFCDALILTSCLSLGLCLGLLAMQAGMF